MMLVSCRKLLLYTTKSEDSLSVAFVTRINVTVDVHDFVINEKIPQYDPYDSKKYKVLNLQQVYFDYQNGIVAWTKICELQYSVA